MNDILLSTPPKTWANMPLQSVLAQAKQYDMDISFQHKEILQHILAGQNLFLSGAAGTGKSTFLRLLQNTLGVDKNIITLAPTGVAALNVGGQTLHSFFKFRPAIVTPDMLLKRRKSKSFQKIDLLVIDEISMVRADLFQGIDSILRKNGKYPNKPFGGVQILLIGDLFQLPPIISRSEQAMFYQMFTSPFFFHTDAFKNGDFNHIELTHIYRQDNPFFINMLNRIRTGNIDNHLISDLNTRLYHGFDMTEIEKHNPTILSGRNETADDINDAHLKQIDSECFTYSGSVDGKFNVAENRMPAPMNLRLKVGARVMITKNDPMGRWVNGTFGYVSALTDDSVYVRCGKSLFTLSPEKWESLEYVFNEETQKWDSKVTGTYKQYPLILAWAITIHKSQGQTLESCILKLDGGAFAAGQLYVALSRCRHFETLFLSEKIRPNDIKISPEVLEFMGL